MPEYKLAYFNVRARAEVSRYLFALAGVPYEDCRFEREEWPSIKPNTPFGQAPILKVQGEVLSQSHAIERYLARKFGLAGKTEWDRARVDMVGGCMDDFTRPVISITFETDEDKKRDMLENFLKEHVPKNLDNFEKILKENHRGKLGLFVGDEITLADVVFYNAMSSAESFIGQQIIASWDRWPGLKNVFDNIDRHPKIRAWILRRPNNKF